MIQLVNLKNPYEFKGNLSGIQTIPGVKLLETVSLFGPSNISKIYDAVSVTSALELKILGGREKAKIFVARSAEQIIADGFVSGCIDRAIVFIGLLKAQGIPARLLETVHIETLQGRVLRTGHAFVEFFEHEYGWRVIDPKTGKIFADFFMETGFIFAQRMPDFWSIEIDSWSKFHRRFEGLCNTLEIPK